MKKNSILLVMFISLFFIFDRTVFAEEKYSCSYNVQYADGGYFNIKAIANKDGSYDVQYQTDSKTWQSTSSYKLGGVMYYKRGDTYVSEGTMMFTLSNLSSKNFEKAITSSKLTTDCPVINVQFDNSSMYYFFFADSSNDIYLYNIEGKLEGKKGNSASEIKVTKTCPFTISTKKVSGMKNFTVYSSFRMKSDGSKLICASATSANLDSSCTPYTTGDYATNISFNGDVYSLKITSGDLNTIFSQTDAQKSKNEFTCPSSMYFVYTSVTDSTLLLTPDKSVAESYDKNVAGNASAEAEETKTESTKKTEEGDYYTGCPLGADVTKDIYGLLKILKIAAPLLVVGLTIVEFVKAIARSEIDGEAKKLGMRLVKRLIIAVILFFLPVLVNQIMIMANIWDENGTCDFSKSADQVDSSKSEGVVTNITTTTTTTTTRSVYIDPGHTSPSGAEHGGGGSRR